MSEERIGLLLKKPGSPAGSIPLAGPQMKPKSAMDLPRHDAVPLGGLKIVARSGTIVPTGLDDVLRGIEDPQEQELVMRLQEILAAEAPAWEAVKGVLADMWWYRREFVQKILPIILKR